MNSYPIPASALDDRLGWIGTSGSGKTYNAAAGVERLLAAGARCIIVDPLDVWWGLRLSSDGASASKFPLPIFGGAHGDLPLNEHAGALIGETVAGMAESCIVSLGGMATKAAERRFMLAFLDKLYRKASGEPVHLIFDEADLWAPQKSSEPMLQNLMEQIVRRGRIKGFIPWLITQRPAVLSKDVLSQVDGLIAFKLTSSQDRDAIGAWIDGQADRQTGKDILASLPTMARGQGVVWVPGRALLETVQFPAKATFDSSRTPERGERRQSRPLRPLDVDALKGRLATVEADAKANDPSALKAEVQRLTSALNKAMGQIKAPVLTPPAPPPIAASQEALDAARADGQRAGIAIGLARARSALDALRVDEAPVDSPKAARTPVLPREAPQSVVAAEGVTGPQQRILNALAWWKAVGTEQPTRTQVAFIASYKPNTGTFNTYLGQLSTAGLISYPRKGAVSLTDTGHAVATAPDDGKTLHDRVKAILSGPQVRLLDPLLGAYPAPLSRADVAEAAAIRYRLTSGRARMDLGRSGR